MNDQLMCSQARIPMETSNRIIHQRVDQSADGWLLPVILIVLTLSSWSLMPAWGRMWLMAVSIFSCFKWWTWRHVKEDQIPFTARSFYYLFLWPGMDARSFLNPNPWKEPPTLTAWGVALAKTLFGAVLIWGVARFAGHGLLAGWIGMIGMIFLLHFGLFDVLSLFWRSQGIRAVPLMQCPIAAPTLSDFWGKRWNVGFRDLVFGLFFVQVARRFGANSATVLTFLFSGLIHELAITVPAGSGYGLPSLYFGLQGGALIIERSQVGVRMGLGKGWRGHAYTLAIVTLPVFALFPPVFVLHVMIPFFQAIKSIS